MQKININEFEMYSPNRTHRRAFYSGPWRRHDDLVTVTSNL